MTDGLKDAHREAIIAVIAANDRVERAVLFGSRATGTNTVTSDVDIALFGERLTLTDRARLTAALEEIPMAQSVDLLLYDSTSDRMLREHIRNHGVEWYPRATPQWRQGVYGRVPVEYVEEPLDSLCVPERGIQTGPFGSQLHKRDYVSEGTPIVTVEHLGDNRLVHRDLPRVSDKDRDRLSKYRLKAGDIVFSRVGSVDRRALVRQEEEGWLFSGRCLRVRGDPGHIDTTFLSYFFGLHAFREHIRSIAVGATMPSLNTRLLSSIVVPHPPLPEQRAVAHILGTLDDKIELNRRMNETLEAMARALFKSWFVDFDPVRATMDGRDTGLPQDIADLFPDRLVDSEMGEIPEGWEAIPLDAIARFQNGLALQKYRPAPNEARLPAVKIAQLRAGEANSGEWASATIRPECIVENGDILFSWSGSLLVKTWCGGRAALNQHLFKVTSERYPKWFYLHSLLSHLSAFQRIAQDKATTMGHIRRHHLTEALCVAPPDGLIAGLSDTFSCLLERQVATELSSRTLAVLRDTLLPKLISGEIRLGKATKAMEAGA